MASFESVPPPATQGSAVHLHRPRQHWRRTRGGMRNHSAAHNAPVGTRVASGEISNGVLSLRPASIAPQSQPSSREPSDAEHSAPEKSSPRKPNNLRGRGGHATGQMLPLDAGGSSNSRRGRGDRVGALTTGNLINHGSGRQFGGMLTDVTHTQISMLQADAPEFLPGQKHQQRPLQAPRAHPPAGTRQQSSNPYHHRNRRGSIAKSNAPDIATRTHEDIANGVYECPICTSEVGGGSKVWSCKTCWTVFHLTCIKKWSQNEGSTLAQQQVPNGDLPPPRQWRCPGCNLPKEVYPTTYFCWCEKEVDPRPISGLPPHSCGQTCGKLRSIPKKCPHPCELLCHAGPCLPCTHSGPVQSCFCGKKSMSRRCVDTDYDTGWGCGEICGDLMPCGEHYCQQFCHEGLCGACEVTVDGRCYCGKVSKPVICCERGDEKESKKVSYSNEGKEKIEEWTGNFDCGGTCDRSFDCGKHICDMQCHPQELNSPHCPRSPDVISHCPCGKTHLDTISDKPRQTCDDPIPNCEKECLKTLPCGHSCQQICHAGQCLPCLRTVSISCRCGRTTYSTVCHQGVEEPPQCMRICKVTLNCGRHECGEHCCPGEKRATERQALKRKLRPLGAAPRLDDGFEAEHICMRLCGRTLKCGNHPCPELCHKGPCGSCREAIFDEISCNCGRTVLQPPLPCGTTPPPCRFECERSKNCGHPQIPHNCHSDEETCPKCPFLVEKPCMCGKKALKNQPCWLADVRCGEICGRKLRCGSHFCHKPCHRPGECEDAGKACQQLCGKAKKSCGHPCEEICHAPSSCREDKPCQSKMLITCDCQHLKQEVKCNAWKSNEGNSRKVLKCDDECARLERNRRLALALNIDPEAHKDDHIPYSTLTLRMFQEATKWAQTQEREFRVFAADETERRLRFKPMPPHHRAFLHSLAEDFGFDSESLDPEPHRHVLVLKTPRFVMAPMKTIAECVRIRTQEAAASNASETGQRPHQADNTPFNGFLLTGPRFALTLDEIRADFADAFGTTPSLSFEISFLPSEEIVLKAHSSLIGTSATALDTALRTLKPSLASITAAKSLASSIHLCALDTSLNVLRQERDAASADGWSQVAAKAAVGARAAPRTPAVGTKSSFTVLGSRVKDARKKKVEKDKEESVVEDWEEEVRREEEEGEAAGMVREGLTTSDEGTTISDGKDALDMADDTNRTSSPAAEANVPTTEMGEAAIHPARAVAEPPIDEPIAPAPSLVRDEAMA